MSHFIIYNIMIKIIMKNNAIDFCKNTIYNLSFYVFFRYFVFFLGFLFPNISMQFILHNEYAYTIPYTI